MVSLAFIKVMLVLKAAVVEMPLSALPRCIRFLRELGLFKKPNKEMKSAHSSDTKTPSGVLKDGKQA